MLKKVKIKGKTVSGDNFVKKFDLFIEKIKITNNNLVSIDLSTKINDHNLVNKKLKIIIVKDKK